MESSTLHLISYRIDNNEAFRKKNFTNSFSIIPNYAEEAKVYDSFLTFLDVKVGLLYDKTEDKFIRPF